MACEAAACFCHSSTDCSTTFVAISMAGFVGRMSLTTCPSSNRCHSFYYSTSSPTRSADSACFFCSMLYRCKPRSHRSSPCRPGFGEHCIVGNWRWRRVPTTSFCAGAPLFARLATPRCPSFCVCCSGTFCCGSGSVAACACRGTLGVCPWR